MKKTVIILLTLFVITFLASCGAMRNRRVTTDTGVIINGVHWATRNVDAPGTFVRNPEDAGMLFQWNRKKAWSTTNQEVTGWFNRLKIRIRDRNQETEAETEWDTSIPDGETWERVNDPCPPGWRVPTEAEFYSLKNSGSVWITRRGVNGRLFGTAPNQLFLPAAGWRNYDGTFNLAGKTGGYWSNTQRLRMFARDFVFIDELVNILDSHRIRGFSIRCVAK